MQYLKCWAPTQPSKQQQQQQHHHISISFHSRYLMIMAAQFGNV
jgi:hypothetical protein